jgi:hypothetical protein
MTTTDLMLEMITKFSLAERLRTAAGLLDDARAGRSDPRALTAHAQMIVANVQTHLIEGLRPERS